jgi:hypothetical protein
MCPKIVALMFLPLLVLACGRGHEVRPVTTPSGRQGFAIRCKRQIDCIDLAGKQCPTGYAMVDRASETEGRSFATADQYSAVGWSRVETTGTMLIECRGAGAPGCATVRELWDRCVASGGRCVRTADGSSTCLHHPGAVPPTPGP